MQNGCNAAAVCPFQGRRLTEMESLTVISSVSLLAGAVAAVSGFGIGSLLTPVLVFLVPLPTAHAVAVLAVPHALATAIRFARLRGDVHRPTFRDSTSPISMRIAICSLSDGCRHRRRNTPGARAIPWARGRGACRAPETPRAA